MPIQLDHDLRRAARVFRLPDGLLRDKADWIAWWYGGVRKNETAGSQPTVIVGFREILRTGEMSGNVTHRRLPLTALGQVRVGTVWREGVCRAEAVLRKETFAVDFTKGEWKLKSFYQAKGDGAAQPYPPDIHPLHYKADRNWLLEFQLPSGGRLVTHCLEFFTRCYGRSAELRRVLATYSWQECEDKRLYAPLDEPEEPNEKWKVKLRKRLVNGDVILLAHAKYDPYTQYAAKRIYAQIEAAHDPHKKDSTYITVEPWFRGPAEISVKGVWFDGGRSFLALQIAGCSDPGGVPILRGRDNSSLTDQPADGKHGLLGEAWAGTSGRKLVKPPEIIDLTGDVEPDPDAISVEVEDPEFEVLGEPRVVIDMRKDQARGSAGPKREGADTSVFSSGEPHGRGQGVGYAAIHAPQVLESHGVLRDMWNAMLSLKARHPDLILSVEWFTFEDGYRQDVDPKLISLKPFDADEQVDDATRKWVYMDATMRQQPRGILVARVKAMGKSIHVIEIQRRPRKKKDSNGDMHDSEDPFKGLAFVLDDEHKFESELRKLLAAVRRAKGIMDNLAWICVGKDYAFKHSPARHEEKRCEAAVMNALGRMGVKIPRPRPALDAALPACVAPIYRGPA